MDYNDCWYLGAASTPATQGCKPAMSKTIFQRIIDREVPARIVHEDDLCLAFHDVNPQAPTHVLVIPKRPLHSVADLAEGDQALAGHLLLVCRKIAAELKLDGGYRIVANVGPDGGQSVDHLHFHILGGRQMGWPPG
jgi:histidine triad (HIT) family protein